MVKAIFTQMGICLLFMLLDVDEKQSRKPVFLGTNRLAGKILVRNLSSEPELKKLFLNFGWFSTDKDGCIFCRVYYFEHYSSNETHKYGMKPYCQRPVQNKLS